MIIFNAFAYNGCKNSFRSFKIEKKKSLWYINDTCSYFILIQIINKVPELMLNNISPHKHLIFYKKNTILVLL